MKSFGWHYDKTRAERKAIEQGDDSVKDSTIASYKKAKATVEDLMKVADKTYDELGKKKSKLNTPALNTHKDLKVAMTRVANQLPFRALSIVFLACVCDRYLDPRARSSGPMLQIFHVLFAPLTPM